MSYNYINGGSNDTKQRFILEICSYCVQYVYVIIINNVRRNLHKSRTHISYLYTIYEDYNNLSSKIVSYSNNNSYISRLLELGRARST